MAIIVEDGTGLADAQAYIDEAYFTAYLTERNILDPSWTNVKIEGAIVAAAQDWIDGEHDFAGDQLTETQALKFPRDEWAGVPEDIKKANAQAAHLQIKGLLLVDPSAFSVFGQVTSESKSVDTLSKSTSYESGTSQAYGRIIPKQLNNLLKPYLAISGGLGMVYRR